MGDKPGHQFRGNQYTGPEGASGRSAMIAAEEPYRKEAARDSMFDSPRSELRKTSTPGVGEDEFGNKFDEKTGQSLSQYDIDQRARPSFEQAVRVERAREAAAKKGPTQVAGVDTSVPDFNQLAKENKIPGQVADVTAGGKGAFSDPQLRTRADGTTFRQPRTLEENQNMAKAALALRKESKGEAWMRMSPEERRQTLIKEARDKRQATIEKRAATIAAKKAEGWKPAPRSKPSKPRESRGTLMADGTYRKGGRVVKLRERVDKSGRRTKYSTLGGKLISWKE